MQESLIVILVQVGKVDLQDSALHLLRSNLCALSSRNQGLTKTPKLDDSRLVLLLHFSLSLVRHACCQPFSLSVCVLHVPGQA